MELKQAVEAVLFACDDPINAAKLHDLLPDSKPTEIKDALQALKVEYETAPRGFTLEEIAGGWQLLTRPQYADIIARLRRSKAERKLSSAALETLAVVAYKQPVTRSRVSAIRGVNCDGVIKTLVTRGLVEECGTEETGAHLYRTTKLFLEKIGINSVEDLPSLAQYLPSDLDEVEVGQG